ncbi:SDR family oxidoreductase [Georgenia subflava]|uniref:SDR family NAD(P)-dependent oxidoreductase n=1 Tax=Georgenia subflava TaxID=1622177 RepID=A0A6N7EI61_9MICO|nr:SDR family oxidoreductase [Georgenia subflava]MPV36793.1 SDR family NAD(P)-dependent oxidoreductase [Georgenia subflava]
MSNYIDGKVIVITGAGSGFGKIVAEKTAELGAKVVGADINEANLQAVVEGIRAKGQTAEYQVADVTSKEQMDAVAALAVEKFGRIDVMLNNAGIMPLAYFADHQAAWKSWDKSVDINIKGVVNGITAVYDQMIAQGEGQVVNISSIYGNYGIPGSGVYSATKAAVKVISDSLRAETKGKIKVTTVKPTGIPGTNLASAIVNDEAVAGLTAHRTAEFAENAEKYYGDQMPAEQLDRNSVKYWTVTPEELAENVVYAINQPWGVSISDITVRASGEDYVY